MSHFIVFLIFFSFFDSSIISCSAHEHGNETGYSYIEETGKGPSKWGQLNESWGICGNGQRQSPIAISSFSAQFKPSLGVLKTNYQSAPATLHNRGHDIKVMWNGDGGNLTIGGTIYKLAESHWHTPSEHRINGIRFAMEQHIVHKSSAGKIAVIGIVYRYGPPDPFLSMLYPKILSLGNGTKEVDLGSVNVNGNKRDQCKGSRIKYFRYNGSLTTPPCSENVTWTLLKQVKTVSRRQVQTLQETVDEGYEKNARPIQPLNRRPVYYY